MSKGLKRGARMAVVVTALTAMVGVMAAPASAAASIGGSTGCIKTHCVVATGKATSGGTSVTGGYGAAACSAAADGATLVQVTCSARGYSRTRTLPGTVGAAELTFPVSDLNPVTVCWSATAYFPNISGGTETVTTSGCGLTV